MKGLAWYSVIAMGLGVVACAIPAMSGIDTQSNLWAVAMYTPVVVFFVRYLSEKK